MTRWKSLDRVGGISPSSLSQCVRKFFLGRDLPMAAGELCFGDGVARQRPDQPQTFFNAAVIEREARGGRGKRGAARTRIDEERRASSFGERKRCLKVKRFVLVLAPDGEKGRGGACSLMGLQDAALGDGETFGNHGLEADIVGAGRDGGFDAHGEQLLEQLEEAVLQGDRQGEHAVQEGRDRRQFFEHRCRRSP